ncbi:dispanin subfamily A member 2b-like [Phyllobates terribilis]|uniref:dispanin subfamily A member 2b-like n=1 Tax=Phyllobates terribilis TaxID=111132 RepID=UPI003CCB5E07
MEGDNKKMYQPTSDVVTMQPGPVAYQTPQKDYLAWSIASLICCFWPLGLVAVIYSVKTRDANDQDNTELAAKHSGTAYALNISATVIGIIIIIALMIFNINRRR